MVLGRPPPTRKALIAATLGGVYATLLLFSAGDQTFVILLAVAWLMLSIGLLFMVPLSYHAFTTWAILWIVWKVVVFAKAPREIASLILDDLMFPVIALALLFTSGYLDRANALG